MRQNVFSVSRILRQCSSRLRACRLGWAADGRESGGRALILPALICLAAVLGGCAELFGDAPQTEDSIAAEVEGASKEPQAGLEEKSAQSGPIAEQPDTPPGRTLKSFSDEQRATLKQRGKYLVTSAGACGSCHGAAGSGIFGPGAVLSGGRLMTDRFGQVRAANITPDPATGIGGWTVEEISSAIRSSIGKSPEALSLDLHAGYRWLAEADTDAIAVYLLSLRPVKNPVERRELGYFDRNKYGLLTRHSPVSGYVPRPKAGLNAANGRYIANNLSRCMVCHNRSDGSPPEGVVVNQGSSLAPGKLLSYLGSVLNAPTMDKTEMDEESAKFISPAARQTIESAVQAKAEDPELDIRSRAIADGIFPVGGPDIRAGAGAPLEAWSAEDIVRYLRTGKNPQRQVRDGRFCPWPYFSTMSDDDAGAIAAYLKRLS